MSHRILCEAKLSSTLRPAPATVITSTGLGVHLVRMVMMMMMMMTMKCSPDKRGFSPQLHLLLGAQLVQDLELVRGLGAASVHLQSMGRYYPAVTPAARTW